MMKRILFIAAVSAGVYFILDMVKSKLMKTA